MARENYSISGNILWEEVSDELVLFKLEAGQYYRFNNTGLIVWKNIVDGVSLTAIIGKLQKEYGIPAETAEKDVNKFIEELLKENLINANE